ncbi:hypothetical protein ACFWOG_09815 [Kitasatospora sp. NPDC058406]
MKKAFRQPPPPDRRPPPLGPSPELPYRRAMFATPTVVVPVGRNVSEIPG